MPSFIHTCAIQTSQFHSFGSLCITFPSFSHYLLPSTRFLSSLYFIPEYITYFNLINYLFNSLHYKKIQKPKYTIAQSYLLQITFTFYYLQIIFIAKKYYSSISNCKCCFTFFNNKIFLYTETNPPTYHYSISSHSIKLTEALPNTNRKLPSPLPPPPKYHYSISSHSIKLTEALQNTNRKLHSPLPPPPKITYPCPNIYIPHFNSEYYKCINLTQFHVSVAIHIIFLHFLFFTPFFLLFTWFSSFFSSSHCLTNPLYGFSTPYITFNFFNIPLLTFASIL